MSRIKAIKSFVNEGNHLTVKYDSNTNKIDMKWNWDALLKEVEQATSSFKPEKNLVEETETKLKKTRKKK